MKNSSLKKNAILNVVKTSMGLLFPLMTFPYVSRVLGPAGLGKIYFSQSVISYFSMVAALGITTYGVREASKLRTNKELLTSFVKELLLINVLSTIIAYILLFICIIIVPKFSEYRILLAVCSGSILFVTIGVEWLYTALEEFSYITFRSIIFQIISLILLFTLVHEENDYLKYAAIGVVSSVGSNLCNFVHMRKYIYIGQRKKIELRKHIKPIFTFFAMTVAVSIYTALDTTMLGFISGDEQVGFYSAATRINKLVLSLITAMIAVLLPRLSLYISQNNKEQFSKISGVALDFVFVISLPCVIGLSIIAKPVMLLLSGSAYINAIPTMRIMNPIIFLISLSNLIGMQMFMPLGRERVTLVTVILGAIVNCFMNMIFIPQYGAYGAGIGTVCAESSVTIFQLIIARKYFIWKNHLRHFLQCIFACLFMSLIIFFISKIEINLVLKLIIEIVAGVLSYSLFLVIVRNELCINFLHGNIGK